MKSWFKALKAAQATAVLVKPQGGVWTNRVKGHKEHMVFAEMFAAHRGRAVDAGSAVLAAADREEAQLVALVIYHQKMRET
jgi:hypothetical protein